MRSVFTTLLLTLSVYAFPQTLQLVKNINTNTIDPNSHSFPSNGKVLNSNFYFVAGNFNGRELWKTNGTAAGTSMVKDLFATTDFSDAEPQFFTVIGNDMYFFVADGTLYKLDGTNSAITGLFKLNNLPTEAVALNGKLYISGEIDLGEGTELIEFDPVNFTIATVQDINQGQTGSVPQHLTVMGNSLFFTADDGVNGRELWQYDQSANMLTMVKDIAFGLNSSDAYDFVVYNNKLYFTANDDNAGFELWVSDGTDAGTVLLEDINPTGYANPDHKTVFNGKLYFSADDGVHGTEVWTTDGTTTAMLTDINTTGSSDAGKYGFVQAGSLLYFAADNGTTGSELWKTDGTTTTIVSNINSGAANAEPQNMVNNAGTLYFIANDNPSGDNYELWKTNGSSTSKVMDVQPAGITGLPQIVGVYNNKVYFYADNGTVGTELWSTDGTTTALLKDINLGTAISSDVSGLESFNSAVYFAANTAGVTEKGLHKSDGTASGTVVIKAGGVNFNIAGPIKKAGSLMYFPAANSTQGIELWKSDGTSAGTVMVKDLNLGPDGSDPADFVAVGSTIYFTADDGVNGRELWKTDGTSAGTAMVMDIRSGSFGSSITNMTAFINKLFFVADDGVNGAELWITDGTLNGTHMLRDIAPGFNSSTPGSLKVFTTPLGQRLFFSADDRADLTSVGVGRELWWSDSTSSGTVLLNDINPGTISSNPSEFTLLNNNLYFSASQGFSAPTLYRLTPTGTIGQFYNIEFPTYFRIVGTRIVFFALPSSSTNGYHLWSTDGTTAGTKEIEDFAPGSLNYIPQDSFPIYNNRMYMWLDNFVNGQELWVTNGTDTGTLMYDIAPGAMSSYPRGAKGVSNKVLFSANDGSATGRELFKIDYDVPLPVTGLDFNVQKGSGNQILLKWKTQAEYNNKGFEIWRSFDGRNFEIIGFVAAGSPFNNGSSYQFNDTKQIDGTHYYRLRQIDLDGVSRYSEIKWVSYNAATPVKLYPNPATEVVNVNVGITLVNSDLIIRNMNGQTVKRQTINGNGTFTIPVKGLASGVYSLEITGTKEPVKLMFVKQ